MDYSLSITNKIISNHNSSKMENGGNIDNKNKPWSNEHKKLQEELMFSPIETKDSKYKKYSLEGSKSKEKNENLINIENLISKHIINNYHTLSRNAKINKNMNNLSSNITNNKNSKNSVVFRSKPGLTLTTLTNNESRKNINEFIKHSMVPPPNSLNFSMYKSPDKNSLNNNLSYSGFKSSKANNDQYDSRIKEKGYEKKIVKNLKNIINKPMK